MAKSILLLFVSASSQVAAKTVSVLLAPVFAPQMTLFPILPTRLAPATGPTLEVPSAIYDKIFDTNVKSFWSFVQEVLPHLQPRANFLFVSSMGAYSPSPPLGLYGVSKTALVALTKLLANELGAQGIRVNCVAPGIIRTRFAEMLWRKLPDGTLPLALRGWGYG